MKMPSLSQIINNNKTLLVLYNSSRLNDIDGGSALSFSPIGRGGGAKLGTVIAEPSERSMRAVKSCELNRYVVSSHDFTARVDP